MNESIVEAVTEVQLFISRLQSAERTLAEIVDGKHCSACSCHCHDIARGHFEKYEEKK